MNIDAGEPWWCEIPPEDWPKETYETIKKDTQGQWGDRKQELVFMGQNMKKDIIIQVRISIVNRIDIGCLFVDR